jgi:ABC-2 type transport system permease protein
MKALQRIRAIVVKEVRQLSRDRLTFGMIVGIPVMQLLLFGYAINTDVRHLSAGLVDLSSSAASREIVMNMVNTQVIDINYQAASAVELESLMRAGKISVGIFIPTDYERRLQQPERSAIQLLVDGSDTIVGAAAASIANSSRISPYNDQPPQMELRTYYNPERRSQVNTVPGLIGVILTMTMTMFTAVAIVRERERGNLELLITTPVRSLELMLAKILPYVLFGLIQVSLVLLLGKLLFDLPLRGQPALHRGQSRHGSGPVYTGAHPVSGHADDLSHPAAVDPAVGIHVPLRRHAPGGTVDRRSAADDAFHAPDPWGRAARRQPARAVF